MKCKLFHHWRKVQTNGFTSYFECTACGARKVIQATGGYQPINRGWVDRKTNKL